MVVSEWSDSDLTDCERLNRRKLLVWTQAAAAVQSLAMAALTLAHVINLWEIIVLATLQGLINAFDMPARQSFLVQMVEDRNDLSNAIAINSSMVNGARLVGPAIAGLLIGAFGEGWCFLVDGVSYFAVIASLLMMRIKPLQIHRPASSVGEQIREDWDYVRTFRPIRTILLLFSLLCLMGYPFAVLLPVSEFKQTEYWEAVQNFQKFIVAEARNNGLSRERLGEAVHMALSTAKPKARYAVVPQRFKTGLCPDFFLRRCSTPRLQSCSDSQSRSLRG